MRFLPTQLAQRSSLARLLRLKGFEFQTLRAMDNTHYSWLPLAAQDLAILSEIAHQIHPSLPERPEVLAEKNALFPSGCRKLVVAQKMEGYGLCHPWKLYSIPALDQFIEHLHPDDVLLHFQLAHRLLRPGGKYIFATPHRFSGPHDISRLFSDVPQGFHLKEWTYRELAAVVKAARFSRWHSYRLGRLRPSWAVNLVTLGAELALSPWPRRLRRKLSARLFTAVTMGVQK